MKLKEFLNGDFDVNCYVKIYECSEGEEWGDKERPTAETYGNERLAPEIADKKIKYVTTNEDEIIVEVRT